MKKRRTKFKLALGVAAIATSLLIAVVPACVKTEDDPTDEENKTSVDAQQIKNGNFEFYNDNKGLYPISNPDSWTTGTSGNASASMSGIIDTAKDNWDRITDPGFGKVLDDNDDLDSDDEDKKDYNGATSDDLLYKNLHVALGSSPSESDLTTISNPLTHRYSYNENGEISETTYKDADGKLFTDEACTVPVETSVLMLHNFRKSYYTGTESYAKSSTTVTLEASTACEISLWVKTCELYFDGATASRTKATSERGAYIKVSTQVGGNDVDDFYIKNINTERLNEGVETVENNGWIQYTLYVEASSFADTTVNLTLGLGQNDIYTVEGYAFFDDIEFKKYTNETKLKEAVTDFDGKVADTTYYPLDNNSVSQFRVDMESIKTNAPTGEIISHTNSHHSANRHFFINFADTTAGDPITIGNSNTKAGFTVEETATGKYVCSQSEIGRLDLTQLANNINSEYIIPTGIKNRLNVSSDIITTFTGIDSADWTCGLGGEYDAVINNALKSAYALPDATGNALFILSARGAAYEAQITDASFSLANGDNALISFWVKTSDMNGKTAATFTVVDDSDKTNSSDFSVDSTTVSAVDIGESKDIYDGWVRCFIRISNDSEESEAKSFKIKINFGSTTIKGSDLNSYNSGWLAVANMSIMKNLDKDVYGYSSDISHAATISFSKKEVNSSFVFDGELGDKNIIETDLAIPKSYDGVNGASAHVYPTYAPVTDYDAANADPYAGLINKYNFENYTGNDWYSDLGSIVGETDSAKLWSKLAGDFTVQPLIIINKSSEGNVRNYGYIGKSPVSVSSNGYTAISVKVKASEGAIANIYLVEDGSETNDVATYSVPKYTFWYDDDGNILYREPVKNATRAQKAANIAYKLRSDGLYEREGVLYSNFYNLTKYYDRRFEYNTNFYLGGNKVAFEDLKTGVDYYANAEGTEYAPHFLVAGGNGNNKLYEYVSGTGSNAVYYYVEKGVKNENKLVHAIDTSVAVPRYTENDTAPYKFTIDCRNSTSPQWDLKDEWVTVTFNVQAGSEAKNFRLELWSGERGEKQTASDKNSYVMFDYSSISLDSSSYTERLSAYADQIIADYKDILDRNGVKLEDNDGTIADLEKLALEKLTGENRLSSLYNYVAYYYTFCLYDSPSFIPFNAETAEDPKAGYSYSYSDYSESLAYLSVEDVEHKTFNSFIDYSILDKDIDIIGAPSVAEDEEEETENKSNNSSNVWLLAASIALVVAIFFTVGTLVLRDFLKKHKKTKTSGKNSYNFNKNKRYVKKYVKANGEAPEIKEGEFDEELMSDKKQESIEKAEEAQVDAPVEETPADDAADSTDGETPSDETKDETKDEASAEETPADDADENKDNKDE